LALNAASDRESKDPFFAPIRGLDSVPKDDPPGIDHQHFKSMASDAGYFPAPAGIL
jgi:hypothetical protein